MGNQYFFGYGSLVNRATHAYTNCAPATVIGWKRTWVSTAARPFAYLSSTRDLGGEVLGLIAEVPGADWTALDEREAAYDRIDATRQVRHSHPSVQSVAIYSVSKPMPGNHPILLSYLDVVLQGYLQEFGPDAAWQFVETTDGWHVPICNDRSAPIYPRHQTLTREEQDHVDALLGSINARIEPL